MLAKRHILNKFLILVFLGMTTLGFRRITFVTWDTSPEDATIWLEFQPDDLAHDIEIGDWQDGADILNRYPDLEPRAALIQAIFDDFLALTDSYIEFGVKPLDGYEFPEGSVAYDETKATYRTISISRKTLFAGTLGSAAPQFEREDYPGYITGCTLNLSKEAWKDALTFKSTLTHELVHCLGLGHHHGDSESLMSYNASSNLHRLATDDKIGLTLMYPRDPKAAEKTNTWGLGCEGS